MRKGRKNIKIFRVLGESFCLGTPFAFENK